MAVSDPVALCVLTGGGLAVARSTGGGVKARRIREMSCALAEGRGRVTPGGTTGLSPLVEEAGAV